MGNLKKHDVNVFIDRYDLANYVETGTGAAECLQYAMCCKFKNFYSVEIHEEVYKTANNILNQFVTKNKAVLSTELKDVKLLLGSSEEKIPEILEKLEGPTMFFLDAHFPGADFRHARYDAIEDDSVRMPLSVELKAIVKNRDISKDVFIIDDLWLYEEGAYEAGSFNAHMQRYFATEKYDAQKIKGSQTSEFIYKLLSETHNVTKDMRDQGYLIFTPKKETDE